MGGEISYNRLLVLKNMSLLTAAYFTVFGKSRKAFAEKCAALRRRIAKICRQQRMFCIGYTRKSAQRAQKSLKTEPKARFSAKEEEQGSR